MARGPSAVYILTDSGNRVLYTGVTNDLPRRLAEHRAGFDPKSFSSRYKLHKLVYYELSEDIRSAIAREKQIKAGSRKKKLELIERMNSSWRDLFEDLDP